MRKGPIVDTPIWDELIEEKKIDWTALWEEGELAGIPTDWNDKKWREQFSTCFHDRALFADGLIAYEKIAQGKGSIAGVLDPSPKPRAGGAPRRRTRKKHA